MSAPSAPLFDYSPGHVSAIESALSVERLQPYVTQAGGNKEQALRLYERNTRLSEALYGPLQGLEIVFRNSFNVQLVKQFGPRWFEILEADGTLENELLWKVQQVRERLVKTGKPETAGRICAELSFGFWVGICAKRYVTPLWIKCLHRPFKGKKLSRMDVFDRLDRLRLLRNRVAHHEPILARDLETDFVQIIQAVAWICGASASWIEATSSFPERFKSG